MSAADQARRRRQGGRGGAGQGGAGGRDARVMRGCLQRSRQGGPGKPCSRGTQSKSLYRNSPAAAAAVASDGVSTFKPQLMSEVESARLQARAIFLRRARRIAARVFRGSCAGGAHASPSWWRLARTGKGGRQGVRRLLPLLPASGPPFPLLALHIKPPPRCWCTPRPPDCHAVTSRPPRRDLPLATP